MKEVFRSFFIPGPLPGLNQIILAAKKGKQAYQPYSIMKSEWGMRCQSAISKAKVPILISAYLEFVWMEKGRRRDPDNIAVGKKFILDALVEYGAIENDGWKYVKGFSDSWEVDISNPGVEVIIHGMVKGRPSRP